MKFNTSAIIAIAATLAAACGTAKSNVAEQLTGEWAIENALGVSTENAETPAFINFEKGGKLNGNASVNTFFGDYKLDGNKLKLGNIGMTRMMGASMEIEDAVTAALNKTASVEINGDSAVILDAEGAQVLVLVRK